MWPVPPKSLEKNYFKDNDLPVLIKDTTNSFQNVLFYGNELAMLMFDITLFWIFDILTGNAFWGLFLMFICDKLFTNLRSSMGEANLAKKTLIDERFLI